MIAGVVPVAGCVVMTLFATCSACRMGVGQRWYGQAIANKDAECTTCLQMGLGLPDTNNSEVTCMQMGLGQPDTNNSEVCVQECMIPSQMVWASHSQQRC